MNRLLSATKLNLEVFSTESSFQFYSGILVEVPELDSVPASGPFSGFRIEPGRFVNAVNDQSGKIRCS